MEQFVRCKWQMFGFQLQSAEAKIMDTDGL